jgi:hypothetical protein
MDYLLSKEKDSEYLRKNY